MSNYCVQGEAIPENLKNMLLVMSNAAVFEVDNNYMMERNRLNNEQNISQAQGTIHTLECVFRHSSHSSMRGLNFDISCQIRRRRVL